MEAYNEIVKEMTKLIHKSYGGYCLSWWLRLELEDKYTTPKINYELSKAVKSGLMFCKKRHNGVYYSLIESNLPNH